VLDANQLRSIAGTVTAIIGLWNQIKKKVSDTTYCPNWQGYWWNGNCLEATQCLLHGRTEGNQSVWWDWNIKTGIYRTVI